MTEHLTHLENRVDKRICIIGGGANGLALLKVLSETYQVRSGRWTLDAFEERGDIGGVWLSAPAPRETVPATPLYESLTTNIPHPVMAYGSFPFPPETPLYPTAAIVLQYLNAYADSFNLRRYIQLRTRLEGAWWNTEDRLWNVTLSNGKRADYDTLLIANGHYRTPRYPRTPGLTHWAEAGRVMHSVWYRRPDQFANFKKLVVVGGGPSARDLCIDLCAVGKLVLQSKRPDDGNELPGSETYRKVPLIADYQANGDIVFEDGVRESGVEFVILATGYEITFPFLSDPQLVCGLPAVPPPFPPQLHNSSYHVFPLAKHMFPIQSTFPFCSAAFTGLLVGVAPFPIFEDQARAIVRVLEDPATLDVPAESVVLIERATRIAETKKSDNPLAVAKAWFRCALDEGFKYREDLHRFVDPDDTWKIPEPLQWMWERKTVLRCAWEGVERRGEAEQWLRGVGVNGLEDWIELCRRLLATDGGNPGESRSSSKL
ncbi:hypothetical protein K488DRAFT_76590 [Vararia minispora EC-137]|uniref:Uncharacterized protein n=1 Tax=Vararia minispora EC-137 TaxID=1314806 RepID=A0ACB8QUA2_9AGAM|nr:hypothetical protein K488DRAFT_76590 [Vararia minispora EC-137]